MLFGTRQMGKSTLRRRLPDADTKDEGGEGGLCAGVGKYRSNPLVGPVTTLAVAK